MDNKRLDEIKETEFFCPDCGKKSVTVDTPAYDYDLGETYTCTSCKMSFYLTFCLGS